MKQVLLSLLIALVINLSAYHIATAQPGKFNQFYMFLARAKVAPQWTVTSLVQYRSYDVDITDSRLFLVNTYADYKLKNAPVQFGGGYMYLEISPYDETGTEKKTIPEHRVFQQVTIGHKLSERLELSQRYRFEERFLFSDRFILRARHLLSANYKLGNLESGKWTLIGKNEIRMNLDKETAFDSFRLWGGAGYKITKTFEVESYWMSQFESGGIFNFGVLSLRKSFDFTRKNKN
ncbi:DUF2490 domain-containing protein [Pedobacter cryoconitis]|uniref:DUF2490 domain-containing protein n=1 Tax=Pedobacter cryoconitis TaxID=188932 RepID=UPI00161FE56B|nr:DUF2490 domain-containing protein [Pedobacter cryoconitis]MBB5646450.1 hypothetical protein [Pedobacter cryoconitis]